MPRPLRLAVAVLCLASPARAELPDPTRPPGISPDAPSAAPSAPREPRLTSIVVAPERRLAVIDGQPVRVGDEIAGARVVTIQPERVRLRRGDETITLRLGGASVKRPTEAQEGEAR